MTDLQLANSTLVAPAQGTQLWAFGVLITMKLVGEQTGGVMSSFEDEVGPGVGPPLHYHTREDETWFMVDGKLRWIVGEGAEQREYAVGASDTIFIPRGTPHAFKNRSDKPARMIVVYTPAGQEQWFLEIGLPVRGPAPPEVSGAEMARALQLGVDKYGLVFLHPARDAALKDEL